MCTIMAVEDLSSREILKEDIERVVNSFIGIC